MKTFASFFWGKKIGGGGESDELFCSWGKNEIFCSCEKQITLVQNIHLLRLFYLNFNVKFIYLAATQFRIKMASRTYIQIFVDIILLFNRRGKTFMNDIQRSFQLIIC